MADISQQDAEERARNHLARELKLKPSDLEVTGVEPIAHVFVVTILAKVGEVGTGHAVRVNRHDGTIEP